MLVNFMKNYDFQMLITKFFVIKNQIYKFNIIKFKLELKVI